MQTVTFFTHTHFGDKPQIDMMFESFTSKEIRICMAEGNIMREHTAPGAIMIMVLKGSVLITSLEESVVLNAGDMIGFEAKVPHSLEAHEESILRLSLSKNDTFKRVIGVL
ncbi:MAG: cupin domain-containing protein [Sulfuricurvum sp.]|uniref:cupin domain-containing protein n=1 Tax=Sulfuricurvum sp. TaxID=2025608 RepID=UPI0026034F15|nr:cupin domain-containing protein [Sulfuricurvum sp.]MDD2827997.1 cupin domain-containing protein [Sulfuricurvum sp.]MDD4948126.1 cupin domain-containing protein [Sulfuricurvum sp.]